MARNDRRIVDLQAIHLGGQELLEGKLPAVIRRVGNSADCARVIRIRFEDHLLLRQVDHHHVFAVEGAPPSGVRGAVDVVLGVAAEAGVVGIVVGIVRERLGQYVPKPEEAALRGLVLHCAARGVDLLELLLVGPRSWRSLYHLAEGPVEGEDGT